MPRPTRAQLRRLLQDWGLPQVDPDSYFIGVFPESISIAVDEVERLTAQDRGWISSQNADVDAVATATSATANLPSPGPNQIMVIRLLSVTLDSSAIQEVELTNSGDSGQHLFWKRGVPGGPVLPQGFLIGTANLETTSFGENLPIVLDGRDSQVIRLTIRRDAVGPLTAAIRATLNTYERPFVGFAT